MGDMVELVLRHLYDSSRHATQGLGVGTANALRVGKLSEGRFLQLLANPFDVHSIAYYALTRINAVL